MAWSWLDLQLDYRNVIELRSSDGFSHMFVAGGTLEKGTCSILFVVLGCCPLTLSATWLNDIRDVIKKLKSDTAERFREEASKSFHNAEDGFFFSGTPLIDLHCETQKVNRCSAKQSQYRV